jgi:hypothetical protein
MQPWNLIIHRRKKDGQVVFCAACTLYSDDQFRTFTKRIERDFPLGPREQYLLQQAMPFWKEPTDER